VIRRPLILLVADVSLVGGPARRAVEAEEVSGLLRVDGPVGGSGNAVMRLTR
jgi:hypothetical protein